jgi:hypothetical protein
VEQVVKIVKRKRPAEEVNEAVDIASDMFVLWNDHLKSSKIGNEYIY